MKDVRSRRGVSQKQAPADASAKLFSMKFIVHFTESFGVPTLTVELHTMFIHLVTVMKSNAYYKYKHSHVCIMEYLELNSFTALHPNHDHEQKTSWLGERR